MSARETGLRGEEEEDEGAGDEGDEGEEDLAAVAVTTPLLILLAVLSGTVAASPPPQTASRSCPSLAAVALWDPTLLFPMLMPPRGEGRGEEWPLGVLRRSMEACLLSRRV